MVTGAIPVRPAVRSGDRCRRPDLGRISRLTCRSTRSSTLPGWRGCASLSSPNVPGSVPRTCPTTREPARSPPRRPATGTASTTSAPWTGSGSSPRAKQLGLSLDEVRDLVDVWDRDRRTPVRSTGPGGGHQLDTVEARTAELAAFAGQLRAALVRLPLRRYRHSTARPFTDRARLHGLRRCA